MGDRDPTRTDVTSCADCPMRVILDGPDGVCTHPERGFGVVMRGVLMSFENGTEPPDACPLRKAPILIVLGVPRG